jgi:formylglycine-generating enzyme required for sulfatase activity
MAGAVAALATVGVVAMISMSGQQATAPEAYVDPVENHDERAATGVTDVVAPPSPYAEGQVLRDCAECPQLIVLSGGTFSMGSPTTEPYRQADEGPLRRVTIAPFAVGKYEVTFDQWAACVRGGGCADNPNPEDSGWGRGERPVINVSWNDAQDYVGWLSRTTGHRYRLLTEAEWEYAARAGRTTPYSTGAEISTTQARFDSNSTATVGSYAANAFGVHDMHGNVWEWVQDWYGDYSSSAQTDPPGPATGSDRVGRGGNFDNDARSTRSANRNYASPDFRYDYLGARLLRIK